VQQAHLNSSVLKIPAAAVADIILQAPASGVISLAGINSEQLRLLLDHADVVADTRRALFLSLTGTSSAEAIVERTADALARTAQQMWPVWYSNVALETSAAICLTTLSASGNAHGSSKRSAKREHP
jgi:hypothetical protein